MNDNSLLPASLNPASAPLLADVALEAAARTPARLFVGCAGPAYRTSTYLALRADHAIARDAVRAELDLDRDLGSDFAATHGMFAVQSCARSKDEYLLRPDLGRRFPIESRRRIAASCPQDVDLQVVIGDGLSNAAVTSQATTLLPLLKSEAAARNWSFGCPFAVRYCRVGLLNDIGTLINAKVVVLLIGERPGLATAESLSAYMAYRPRPGQTDADRNVISNIHSRGLQPQEATARIANLATKMMTNNRSGVGLSEEILLPEHF